MKIQEELPMFSSTLCPTTTAKLPCGEIKFKISGAMANDDLCSRVLNHLTSKTSIGGSIQFNHSMAAFELNTALELTTQYKTITIFKIWELLSVVLKKHGYTITKGRVDGHISLEHKPTADADADAAVAPPSTPMNNAGEYTSN